MKVDVLLGILVTIALGVASFSLHWTFDANATIQVQAANYTALAAKNTALEVEIDAMKEDKKHAAGMRMLWVYCTFLHDQINALDWKDGIQPASTPNFASEQFQ